MPALLTRSSETEEQLVQIGLRYAAELLDTLIKHNGEYRNTRPDVATFLMWLSDDHPQFAIELGESGFTALFARRLGRFLCLAEKLDELVKVLAEAADEKALPGTDTMENKDTVRAAVQRTFPRWSSEVVGDVIDDAVILLNALEPLASTSESEVVKAPLVKRYMVNEVTPALETVRRLAKIRFDTCFLVSRNDAPEPLSKYIHEKVAVVVPLVATFDESWIFHSTDVGISYQELVIDDGNRLPSIPVMMTLDERRVLFDFEALRESVFRSLRVQLPVMYVSTSATILVTYPFHQFAFENAFYSAVTGFQIAWENPDCDQPFEQRLDRLRRDSLPHFVYVNRFVDDMTGHAVTSRPFQSFSHWLMPTLPNQVRPEQPQ